MLAVCNKVAIPNGKNILHFNHRLVIVTVSVTIVVSYNTSYSYLNPLRILQLNIVCKVEMNNQSCSEIISDIKHNKKINRIVHA